MRPLLSNVSEVYTIKSDGLAYYVGPRQIRRMAERREMGRVHDIEAAKREHQSTADQLALLDMPQRASSAHVQAEIRALKSKKLQLKDRIASLTRGLVSRPLTGREGRGELGSGSFAKVLLAECLSTGVEVAVKVADTSQQDDLRNEYLALRALDGHARSFPRAHHFGIQTINGQHVAAMVMDRLGPSLESTLYRSTLGVGGLRDCSVLFLAHKMVSALQILCMNGIVHRDCQPGNWLLGLGDEGKRDLMLIDFGCCLMTPRSFISPRQTDSRPSSSDDPNRIVRGTLSFSSARLSRGEPSFYCDDLETVAYVLMSCLSGGSLPWSHLDAECARLSCEEGWGSDSMIHSFYEQAAVEKDKFYSQISQDRKGGDSAVQRLAVDLLVHSRSKDMPDYGLLLEKIVRLRQETVDEALEWDEIGAF
jgi:serine/threonine protein kinase